MSKIVEGGRPDAIVVGAVIQELDASKNVVFQWRTLDYIDVTASYFDLTQKNIPYGHANAIDVDKDGNILFSLRYLSAVVKINRETGDIIGYRQDGEAAWLKADLTRAYPGDRVRRVTRELRKLGWMTA